MGAGGPRQPRGSPLTMRGGLFLLASIPVLLTGVLRSELAALLWGGGMVFIILYSMAAVPLAAVCIRRRLGLERISFGLTLEPRELYPNTPVLARLRLDLPGLLPPGTAGTYLYKTETPEGGRFSWEAALLRGRNTRELSLAAPSRGIYAGPPGYIVLEDLFGFARREVPFPGEEKITVYPEIYDRDVPLGTRSRGGEKTFRDAEKKRSDEFLETRKYTPGDDVRRINWKVFAHAEELIIRIGEEEPPPESVTLLLVDPRIDLEAVPAILVRPLTDRMAALAARLVLSLSGRGRRVLLSVPEASAPLPVEPEKPGPALALLAGLGTRREKPPLPSAASPDFTGPGGIIVLAFPGWPGRKDLPRPAGREAEFILGLVGPGETETAEAPLLRDLVFLPPPNRAGHRKERSLALRALNERLLKDKEEFENGPRRAEHVEIL